ncbi:MAG: flagellin [Bryobacteraceae bacterium]
MAQDISLSSSARSILLSLTNTQSLVARTQNRLSNGLKVASAIDDATSYFQSKTLNDRASDFADKKSGIDQAVSSLNAALEATDAVDSLVRQLKGLAISAKTATGTELSDVVTQFNDLRGQIDLLTGDASYQGLNLINGTGETLTVSFSNDTASILDIDSVDLTVGSLGLDITSAASFSLTSNVEAAITELDSAITTLRSQGSTLGSNVSLLQTRLEFTQKYVNVLEGGASKLTLADINEEGANLVALQTRQQLSISALAFAGQSEQSVLSLFR